MMQLVILALRRPYTFICGAILVLLLGVFAITRMPVDIFPAIDLPVATVVWTFNGLDPEQMEQRITTITERIFSNYVSGVEHIESRSYNGVATIKIYFHPGTNTAIAMSQLTASAQSIVRILPTGITPPAILLYNATDAPVLQVGVGSKTLSEDQLNDIAGTSVRTPLATVGGVTIPPPYGGRPRLAMVDINLNALYAKGLSPADVSTAINNSSVILPTGTAKMGSKEYTIGLNTAPDTIERLNDIPIKVVNGAMVYVRDVANVRLGAGVQTNIVRENGSRGTYLAVLKTGAASTLAVVNGIKAMLPHLQQLVPPGVDLRIQADQSIFVKAAITGVVTEACIAGCLTAFMILLFIGSWRSTLIVATSIPLAILCSIICLMIAGQTLNQMTLGGLALAVGILVDDATVEIENINRHIEMGSPILQAIVDAASEIATPAFVATLSISIVFMPIFLLTGPAASLFRPLAMAVVFAVLASYLLSRTIVPTMARYLLAHDHEQTKAMPGVFGRIHQRFNHHFEQFRHGYFDLLGWVMVRRRAVLIAAGAFCLGTFVLLPFIGEDFFPSVDGGQFDLHVRAPAGTKLESTEQLFERVEAQIHNVVPASDLDLVSDDIGLNGNQVALATGEPATLGPADGDILVSLKPNHKPTIHYIRRLREVLPREFPSLTFFFAPSDLVSSVLDLGLPAPIDVQVYSGGTDKRPAYNVAVALADKIKRVPGAVDVRVGQVMDYPEIFYNVDRDRAQQLGLTEREVASDVLVSLSSSGQTAPNFYVDPKTGTSYQITVQTPQYKMSSMDQLAGTPITPTAGLGNLSEPQLFGNLAVPVRKTEMAAVDHYNVNPVFDVYASTDRRDLGGVAADIDKIVAQAKSSLPRGAQIVVRGQVQSMRSSFLGLGIGIAGAVILAYILMVVNFQSWLDPLVIVLGLPGALAGILWMLFATGTTFTVPALMGTIMAVGVATSNSILLIVFAEDQRRAGRSAMAAAMEAGYTRLRPVCMTALAMMIGMTPMALGLSDGGEQNAPLGRAVVGGLMVATIFTLVIVPVLYTMIRTGPAPVETVVPEVSVNERH
jgi:multidrug efflux pump subunit AcrB